MLQLLLSTTALAAALAGAPVARDTATFTIDKAHSELTFRIRHMMSRVSGTFGDWRGALTGDPAAWTGGTTEIVIQAASIDTRNEKRDSDLRSPDFFDAAMYPVVTFRSTSVSVAGSAITLKGELTMHGVTKPVTLTGEYLGSAGQGPKQRVGFHVTGTINRQDFGITWNRALDAGGLLLGDEVELDISIEAVRAA